MIALRHRTTSCDHPKGGTTLLGAQRLSLVIYLHPQRTTSLSTPISAYDSNTRKAYNMKKEVIVVFGRCSWISCACSTSLDDFYSRRLSVRSDTSWNISKRRTRVPVPEIRAAGDPTDQRSRSLHLPWKSLGTCLLDLCTRCNLTDSHPVTRHDKKVQWIFPVVQNSSQTMRLRILCESYTTDGSKLESSNPFLAFSSAKASFNIRTAYSPTGSQTDAHSTNRKSRALRASRRNLNRLWCHEASAALAVSDTLRKLGRPGGPTDPIPWNWISS